MNKVLLFFSAVISDVIVIFEISFELFQKFIVFKERVININLFSPGNEISKIDGLEGLYQLRELVLDKNKIKVY